MKKENKAFLLELARESIKYTLENGKVYKFMNFDKFRSLNLFGKIPRVALNYYKVKNLDEYDVTSYVHRITFLDKPNFLRLTDLDDLRRKSKILSYTGLGCDEISFIHANDTLLYKPCETCQKYDDPDKRCEKVVRTRNQLSIDYINENFNNVVSSLIV